MLQAYRKGDLRDGRYFELILSRNSNSGSRDHEPGARFSKLRCNNRRACINHFHFRGNINEVCGIRLRQIDTVFRQRREDRNGTEQ